MPPLLLALLCVIEGIVVFFEGCFLTYSKFRKGWFCIVMGVIMFTTGTVYILGS